MSAARHIASVGGLGFVPKAPGTVASAAALILGAGLLWLEPALLPLACLAAIVIGLWAVRAVAESGDPGWIVIDEVAGQWVALLGLTRPSMAGLAAAFLLFRLLDIAKPGPVGWADRQRGAAAVMGDDLVAGMLAAGILWALGMRFPGLFG
ncbi:MAG: phosphatidylglycerophosphatase A [Rhodospirillales bacterium]|nr:phosphatidylglycerophosphatase A [Rhodospirillales bacterium]